MDLGHTRKTIEHRLSSGRWLSVHPKVFRFAGSPVTWEQEELAGAYWAEGLASGLAAARIMELPGFSKVDRLEVLTSRRINPRSGIVVHHTDRLPREQIAHYGPFPITSIERTLLDLGALTRRDRVAIALDDALRRGMATLESLDHALFLVAKRGRRGCAVLRSLVHERLGIAITPHSPLETLCFEMLQSAGLPMPELQYEIFDDGEFVARPDFVYPEHRLIIECQSYKWHSGRHAWQADSDRLTRLVALGWRVIWVTWNDVTSYRQRTVGRIRRALAFFA